MAIEAQSLNQIKLQYDLIVQPIWVNVQVCCFRS